MDDDNGSGNALDHALGASYLLVEELGHGATGEVWRAVDRRTGAPVAAKLLRREHARDQDLVGRFVRERSILTGLRHPHVVTVRDLVVEGDRLAIVMDLVDGGSLRDVLRRRGPLAPATAVEVVAAVLDGLAAAHAQGVLHRDVKPDNVLLTDGWDDPGAPGVRLTDFGIARMVAEGAGTTTGLLGTPEYMAPELLVTGAYDFPADVYGAGILLHELLAGRSPFAGPGTDYTVAHRHVTSLPPPLAVPEGLRSELSSLLDKDPAQRPAAAEAAARLRRLAPGLAGLAPLPPQDAPEQYDDARGPVTVVRGLEAPARPAPAPTTPAGPTEPAGSTDPAYDPGPVDLGEREGRTIVRPMAVPRPAVPEPGEEQEAGDRPSRGRAPRWRDPRAIALVLAGVVLLAGAVVFATFTGGSEGEQTTAEPAPAAAPVQASQLSTPTPTGLTVRREAVWDPRTEEVELTLTYAAQNATLGGPFLEVLPDAGGGCADVTWATPQEENLPSTTGITAPCGWSVDPGPVPAQGSAAVTARLPLDLDEADAAAALQQWLDDAAGRTTAATTDPEVTSTAYPAQRLQGVQLEAPPRTVSGRTLRLSVLPVWPGGLDRLNPLYRSPAVGEPSSLLTAVAGGEEGLRFSDGCAGALQVSPDGLVVTALNVAAECEVIARVGNIAEVRSNPVAIVTRGG